MRLNEAKIFDLQQKNGANDRNRTGDLFITSELLYRLSYVGITNRDSL